MNDRTRVLVARWIIPVSRDPINGGWVRLREGRIAEVGQGDLPAAAEDLGDVALLPGLVNAHTHLEFSDFRSPIGTKGVPLHKWIGEVVAARRQTTAQSKQNAIATGLTELCDSGTRLAGEITTPPCEYLGDLAGLELVTFAEVLGLDRDRTQERLEAAKLHNAVNKTGAWSPHAPYSTSLETIDACIELAQKSERPLAMHVAESPAERELLIAGTGPLAELLRSLGVWRDQLFPWGKDAFSMLIERLSHAPRVMLIHGNELNDQEIQRLRAYRNMTVVYCPRTHHFFGYEAHPVGRMLDAGVRVALGTDSRASNPDLNLWHEVQFLLQTRGDLPPRDVLRMATLCGADALGRPDLGRIEIGCDGAMGTVPTTATTIDNLYEDLSRNPYRTVANSEN